MKFAKKKIECEARDLHKTIRQTELEWLGALLLRLKLDPVKIEAAITQQSTSNQAWRDYLITEAGVNIIKTATETVVEKHYVDKPKVLLGQWKKPEIVRVKRGDFYQIELRLKYWQLI